MDTAPVSASDAYAELHCLSSFSFQRGASQPEELVARAHALGYSALAITDECSVAGVVRAHGEAKRLGLRLLHGAHFVVPMNQAAVHDKASAGEDGATSLTLIALAHDVQGWGNLCEFITLARRAAPKGQYRLDWREARWELLSHCEVLLALPPDFPQESASAVIRRSQLLWGQNLWLTLALHLGCDDALQLQRMRALSRLCNVPLVATGKVLMHVRSRKPLHDVMTAVRLGVPVSRCGLALQANAEAHLRSRARLAGIYPADMLANTLVAASRCNFSLESLRYHYPLEAVLPGYTAEQTLRRYTEEGARERYPAGVPPAVRSQIEHELALIGKLRYEMYFLTVHDIVRFARSRDILCQGRGSAANSAVCYCLGVTEVDPARMSTLFERFISQERNEPPDIDVDFEHQRREEVIQYIYAKYGRDRAAIAATVISYRPRSALRDVGAALEIPQELVASLSKEHPGMYTREVLGERLQAALERLGPHWQRPSPLRLHQWLDLSRQLQRFPRHLSQHVGGFVLTQGPLNRLVPVENASMPERSVIQWDKDDLDEMGLLKVDVLALGMLSAIRRCLALAGQLRGTALRMQDIPAEDPLTYDMICQADTVGVFQIESRAQMSMLPRLRPRCFYDLVVEVAIVRPGPIQGGMVHPYLRARSHPENVQYASAELENALKRTLGVPIFQEQVMQIAMLAADFTAGEADSLRRSMAAWKRKGGVHVFYDRMISGMLRKGYSLEFSENIFRQIEGFGEYGFPESHAASFALLVYVSCWLKRHEPACFLAAMLNSQPLGFYAPSQLVQDARRHGIVVLAIDVLHSQWDCTLESLHGAESADVPASTREQPPVRLGLRMVKGLRQATAQRIVAQCAQQAFASIEDLALRCGLDVADLKVLAAADALNSLAGQRRQQVWEAAAMHRNVDLLQGVPVLEPALQLPLAPLAEEVVFDYAATGLSLRCHPVSLLRDRLAAMQMLSARELADCPAGRLVRACGIVTMRQQPQTAKGVIFVTLEDETGSVNLIVWHSLKLRQRQELMRSRLLAVAGVWQRDEGAGQVCHLIARRLRDMTHLLGDLVTPSRDFH
jgi:error-prone DNA polymerase